MTGSYNRIRLAGRVESPPVRDHAVFGEVFYRMTLACSRLSGTEDVLPVTVPERVLIYAGEPGEVAELSGQIRSYDRRSEGGARLMLTVFARELIFPRGREAESLADANDTELIGRILKPVIYRTTPFMREIADLLIGVERGSGKCDRLPVIAWGRNARFAAELAPGQTVLIRGRLQSRQYRKQLPEGSEERTAYEVSCSSIELLN